MTKEQIVEFVKEIAHRMRDPDCVKEFILHPTNQNSDPLYSELPWDDLSLAGGHLGILPLFGELDRLFPNEKWDVAAHSYVTKIKESIEKTGINRFSLFGGLAGLCFSLQSVSRGGIRYGKMIDKLNIFLLEGTKKHYLTPFKANLRSGLPSPQAHYELIQGISGIAVYALNNLHLPLFANLIKDILHLLVALTEPIKVKGFWVPGWYTPYDYQLNEGYKKTYLQGNFNLGLSHGISGVLSILAISSLMGIAVEGQKEAMERIVDWLLKHRRFGESGHFWEAMIAFEIETEGRARDYNFLGKDAWCYGTPGVARSLFLSGRALNNNHFQTMALNAFCSIFKRSRQEWHLPGPTFCHGISGLLLTTALMAVDSQNECLQEQVLSLKQILLEYYHPENPFGFKDLSPQKRGGFFEVNRIDLLEGVSGILLTLLSLDDHTSWWHAPFLISERK